jgi:hypothetical protein
VITLPRHAELWAPGLVRSWWRDRAWRPAPDTRPTCWLLFTDHFEPCGGRASDATARERMGWWTSTWPRVADRHRDSFGRPPRFTFFYPAEEYQPWVLDELAGLTRLGVADVEVHLHHDGEPEAEIRALLVNFVTSLRRDHGLLRDGADGNAAWCFIHGNWALDNSHPEGRWCGLNNEITLLQELGCRADFTLPSAPSGCQTSTVNSIYWALDDPLRPKSHDRGAPVTPGGGRPDDALLMVQGPLTVRRHPRYRVLPTLEVGELAGYALPTPARVRAWLRAAPRVGNHLFVKLFGHGAQERNGPPLLADGGLDRCLTMMRDECDRRGWQLGFLSAWEATRLLHDIATGVTPAAGVPEWLQSS